MTSRTPHDDQPPDAVEAPPWNGRGPQPRVTVYEPAARPALWIRAAGRWRYAPVLGRFDYADGARAYQVEVRLPDAVDGVEGVRVRSYGWPQPGVREAHGPR